MTHRLLSYGFALAIVGIVVLVAPALARLSPAGHFLFATGAVVLAAWFGGFGPGALATALIAALELGLLREIRGFPPGENASLVALFAIEGWIISAAGGLRRRAERLLRRRTRQHVALAELSRWSIGAEPLQGLLEDAARIVLDNLDADRVEISETRGRVIRVDRSRFDRDRVAVPRELPGGPVPGPGGREGRAFTLTSDAAPRRALKPVASVPIMGPGEPFAHLGVFATAGRRISGSDLDFVHAVSNVLAGSLRRRRADDETERLRRRDALLADVTSTLGLSLDFDTRASGLAESLAPRLADWCVVDVLEESGRLRRFSVEHGDPGTIELARRLHGLALEEDDPENPLAQTLRSGAARLLPRLSDADLDRLAGDASRADALRDAGLRSLIAVPLRARGRTLGVVTLGAVSRAPFEPQDLTLAEEVAQRAALALDNARLYERLLADDRAKDEFLAMLGHELRNPLAPMVHSLEVFRVASPDSEARERARRVLERQVAQLRHLVRDLLDVARVTRGTIALRREPVELNGAVASAIETCQPHIQSHRHVLVTHLPAEPVWVDADPVRLEQILTNLVNNAVEHSRPQARSELTLEREGEHAVIRVKDNGAGLEPAMLSRIFDLFTRGDIMESGPGTGIGLHLVRRLVELHGGTIEARSGGVGRGSEFIVRLPAITEALVTEPAVAAAPEPAGHLRVLVVDDHMDTAAALAELLGLWGYEARTALDGREALKVAESFRPELVLLDLAMPDMNGYQVAAELRRMPELAGMTLVALTGHAREPNRERAAGYPFDHHWIKPLDSDALRTFLAERAKQRHSEVA